MSQRVIVASTNPVKIDATRDGFRQMFPDGAFTFESVDVPSGVSVQPFGNDETLQGALNRAENARTSRPDADFWVGIEGGVESLGESLLAFAWVVVLSHARTGKSKTGAFVLPASVVALVKGGLELGHADDQIFGRSDSKRQGGSVGLLTDDALTRRQFYAPSVVLALIPFKNPQFEF